MEPWKTAMEVATFVRSLQVVTWRRKSSSPGLAKRKSAVPRRPCDTGTRDPHPKATALPSEALVAGPEVNTSTPEASSVSARARAGSGR